MGFKTMYTLSITDFVCVYYQWFDQMKRKIKVKVGLRQQTVFTCLYQLLSDLFLMNHSLTIKLLVVELELLLDLSLVY